MKRRQWASRKTVMVCGWCSFFRQARLGRIGLHHRLSDPIHRRYWGGADVFGIGLRGYVSGQGISSRARHPADNQDSRTGLACRSVMPSLSLTRTAIYCILRYPCFRPPPSLKCRPRERQLPGLRPTPAECQSRLGISVLAASFTAHCP